MIILRTSILLPRSARRPAVGLALLSTMGNDVNAIHQTIAGRKRFYKKVDVIALPDIGASDIISFGITLDGKKLKTPARNGLHLPTFELAAAIAAEWDAQVDDRTGIQPATMPLMSLAATAIDHLRADASPAKVTCLSYLPTDTAIFWTADGDRLLLKKQRQNFEPVLRWLRRTLQIELLTTREMSGRLHHPPATVARVQSIVNSVACDPFILACLQCATMECKSLVLALAFLAKQISLDQVKVASRLEEEFQVEIWGVVEGGHDMDRLNNSVSLASVDAFMGLYLDSAGIEKMLQQWKEASAATIASAVSE